MLGRGFRKEWKEEYTWLDYNEDEGKMYCRVCKDFPNIALSLPAITVFTWVMSKATTKAVDM